MIIKKNRHANDGSDCVEAFENIDLSTLDGVLRCICMDGVYVWMSVCMYSMDVCMYGCVYAWMCVCTDVCMYGCVYVCMVCMHMTRSTIHKLLKRLYQSPGNMLLKAVYVLQRYA